MQQLEWHCKTFSELSNDELYALIKHRIDIFVVEQACAYAELDNKDRHADTRHVLAYDGDALLAYARLLPPGLSYRDSSIGRFAVREDARAKGLGANLLQYCVDTSTSLWPTHDITISAQAHLSEFYSRGGFMPASEPYLEDGIPHIEMHRAAKHRSAKHRATKQ